MQRNQYDIMFQQWLEFKHESHIFVEVFFLITFHRSSNNGINVQAYAVVL